MGVEILPHQFSICQKVNGKFCNVITPLQPLANPPSCITALYSKNTCSISTRHSLQISKIPDVGIPSQLTLSIWILTTPLSVATTALYSSAQEKPKNLLQYRSQFTSYNSPSCNATTPNFQLPPHYENSASEVNISSDMANLNMINISSVDFCIWQHLEKHQNKIQLQHFASIASVPVEQCYRHVTKGIQHIIPFTSPEESTADTASIWTLFLIQESM